jgi:hypothetical protein
MARKMKKFSAGGAQGRYDRRMTDIDKDFKKDSAGKTGKALEVLEAKRAQRTADAKDDLAKRTGADRTATRAAERLAESNLTKTRKYGAPQSVTKDTAGPTGKVTDTLGAIIAPKSELASKPSSFKEAFKEARSRLGAGKTFTFGGKSYTTNIAGEGRKPVQKPAQKAAPTPEKKAAPEKAVAPSKFDSKAFADLKAKMPKPTVTTTGGTALRGKPGAPLVSGTDTRAFFTYGKAAAEKNAANKAKGGAVKKKETTMKYRSGGSTPPKPTAADRAADAKFRKSIKNLKPTPEQAAAIGRANRSSGYAKGGKVKKMAFGGTSLPSRVASSLNKTLKPRTPSVIGPSANKANAIANSDKLQQGAAAKAAQASPTAPAAPAAAQAPTNIGRLNMGHAKGGNVKKMAIGGIPAGASTTVLRPPIMSGSPNAPTMQPATSGGRVANTRTAAVSRRAEGGTAKAAKGGKATKFGKALVKKSADTKGRAMMKKAGGGKCYASGGSVSSASKRADGCAVKGKTKGKMLARGGSAKMRGRDSYGGANFKKGGSC